MTLKAGVSASLPRYNSSVSLKSLTAQGTADNPVTLTGDGATINLNTLNLDHTHTKGVSFNASTNLKITNSSLHESPTMIAKLGADINNSYLHLVGQYQGFRFTGGESTIENSIIECKNSFCIDHQKYDNSKAQITIKSSTLKANSCHFSLSGHFDLEVTHTNIMGAGADWRVCVQSVNSNEKFSLNNNHWEGHTGELTQENLKFNINDEVVSKIPNIIPTVVSSTPFPTPDVPERVFNKLDTASQTQESSKLKSSTLREAYDGGDTQTKTRTPSN